ncbi:NAD-dependent epimerase/dehydratase family protein, partial [Rhodococcus sp. NPDC058505]|uniref:NAD-dependent epimerase/dehydratase family protein n=1 Tax=Rhodococcus sp. NPDC058505 TaxID=3346531 RepID=UPI00365D98C7
MTTPGASGHGDGARRVAVVGASGFIGAATLRALLASGHRPVAITRTAPPAPEPDARYVRSDVPDREALLAALRGADAVVHAVSYTGPDERRCRAVNLTGTANVLAAADTLGITRIVTVSTVGVYGPGPFRGIAEEDREPNPVTALSATRAAADRLARAAGRGGAG